MTTQDIIELIGQLNALANFCKEGSRWYIWPEQIERLSITLGTVGVEANVIDYINRGKEVAPVVMELRKALREFLEIAVESRSKDFPRLAEYARKMLSICFDKRFYGETIGIVEEIAARCEKLLYWIDLYFPPVEAAAHQEARPKAERPKSAAAVRLESQELQDIKKALTQAGIIEGGQWQGSHAEFGCLVVELFEQKGVAHHGGRAWKDCAMWAGYSDDTEKARKAIEANPNTRGPIADKIRAICKAR